MSIDEIYDPFVDSYLTDSLNQLPLAGGGSYTVERNISNLLAEAGDYYLLFVTDTFLNQPETNENNNTTAVPLTITNPDVDLIMNCEINWLKFNEESLVFPEGTITNFDLNVAKTLLVTSFPKD
jgi:hypothetical protein